jgi:hypothetical protein
MTRSKPVGSAEAVVLQRLAANDGKWAVGDRPLWESQYWTLQLLGSLTRKGLVSEVVPDEHYVLTGEGFEGRAPGVSPQTPASQHGQAVRLPKSRTNQDDGAAAEPLRG